MLGDILYALQPMEAASAPVVQRSLQISGNAALATTVDADFPPVPLDKVFLLTHIACFGIAGGVLLLNSLAWSIRTSAGPGASLVDLAVQFNNPGIAGPGANGFDRMMNVLLMPSEFLRLRGTFSNNTSSNTVSASVHGLFLPKGTIQLR